jgi:hypothetical protein
MMKFIRKLLEYIKYRRAVKKRIKDLNRENKFIY